MENKNNIGISGVGVASLQEKLKEKILYDPDTGIMTHRVTNRRARAIKGNVAGSVVGGSSGRRVVYFNGNREPITRLIILYMEGWLPKNTAHKDNDYTNCRYNNIIVTEKKACRSGGRKAVVDIEDDIVASPVVVNKVAKVAKVDSIIEAPIVIDSNGKDGIEQILSVLDNGGKTFEQILRKVKWLDSHHITHLVDEGLIEVREHELGEYHLTKHGHARSNGDKEYAVSKKMELLLMFYRIMPNFVDLPLNNVFDFGEVYEYEY